MSKTLNKDKQKFEVWINEYHNALFRHAFWMTSRSEVAEDCVQEVYYQAWKVRKSLKDESKIFSWLLTILNRIIYREYSQRAQNSNITQIDYEVLPEQSENLDQGDLLDVVKAMSTLSIVQRDILLLYGLHGFSYKEISVILEIPVGTVMSRISRARTALNHALNCEPQAGPQGHIVKLNPRLNRNE